MQLIITEFPLFVECNVGYVGKNCSMPCPYNSYGKLCQMTCTSTKDECDLIRGCEKREFGNWLTKNCANSHYRYITNVTFNQGSIVLGNETTVEVSEATTERMRKMVKISCRNLLKYVLIGLSSPLGIVCIMHIIWIIIRKSRIKFIKK